MKEFHRRDFANRTGLAQAWTVKSADRLFTQVAIKNVWTSTVVSRLYTAQSLNKIAGPCQLPESSRVQIGAPG